MGLRLAIRVLAMTADATSVVGWYVTREDGMDGPLSNAEMRVAISRGQVKPEDYVWREGMAGWAQAREIPNFSEIRRTHLEAEATAGREKSRDRVRAQRNDAGSARERGGQGHQWPETAAPRSGEAAPSYRTPQPAQAPAPWSAPTSAKPSVEMSDFEKLTKDLLGKLSAIPQGAIAFVVLGLIFTPLLPLFWFLAWRIWANKKG